MLSFSVPPGYLGPFTGIIADQDDRTSHRKQRHTWPPGRVRFHGRLHHRKDYVREQGLRSREVFVPLSHSPGHAQADFGEAMAVIGGALRKIHFLAFDSDGCFVAAYPADDRSILRWPQRGVCLLRGVPSCTTTPSWRLPGSWAMGSGSERASSRSQSHYLFDSAGRARATTRARSRDWSSGGTSWSPSRVPRAAALNGSRRTVPPAPGGAAAGPQGDHRRASRAGSSSSLAIAACSL